MELLQPKDNCGKVINEAKHLSIIIKDNHKKNKRNRFDTEKDNFDIELPNIKKLKISDENTVIKKIKYDSNNILINKIENLKKKLELFRVCSNKYINHLENEIKDIIDNIK